MRDPLQGVSVRYKLAAMFVGFGLIAYGLGGFLVTRWSEGALEDEILARLGFQARAYATGLDASLRLLSRRAEDFASDGLIRDHAERLQAAPDAAAAEALARELRRHLAANKLPLEPAFENLAVAGADGRLLAIVHEDEARALEGRLAGAPDAGGGAARGIVASPRGGGPPGVVLAAPLRSLDASRVVGRLLVLVRAGDWIGGAVAAAAGDLDPREPGMDVGLIVRDGSGRELVTSLDARGAVGAVHARDGVRQPADGRVRFAPVLGTYARSFPLADRDWSAEVTLGIDAALRPISGLRSRLIGVGVVLAVVSALLLFFPMRFVVRPLLRLTRAAERLREGSLGTRVEVESDDEIGELGRAFNGMAAAIQERTGRLEHAASELRARQDELRAGRDRLETVISSMHDGLMVIDAGGRVVIFNAAARPLLDLVEAGVVARSHHVCRDEPAAAAAGAGEGAAAASRAAGGGCFACMVEPGGPSRSCLVDVGPRTFEIHVTPLPPDGGPGRGRVLVSREVTDRIQRDEREIHNERLAVLGEVAAVMAHELNNPLASISMFNQMLAAELPAGSPLHENTDVIARNTDAAKRAIRELLDYATGATPEVGPIDVHDTLQDVLRFLRPLSERAGVAVRLRPEAERSEVTGDEVQLRQVFVNLTLNAVQAVAGRPLAPGSEGARAGRDGRRGEVTLSTRTEGDRLVIDVRDTGPGIAPEDRERIFRPFFTTKSRGEGTGLGLPTTRRLTEMHGGSLELVESSPAGTVFRVTLRVRAPVEAST